MKLRAIELEGFQSYRDRERVEVQGLTLAAIVGKNHTGKCLPGDTRIYDPDLGAAITIEQFVAEKRQTTLGFTKGSVVPVGVSDWHDLGVKPLVRVTLEDGAELVAATTHPILTDTGCIRAGDLEPGQWVAQASRLPSSPWERLSVDEAFILGCYLGDGCVTNKFATFTCAEAGLLDRLSEAIARTFPGAELAAARNSLSNYIRSSLTEAERADVMGRIVSRMRAAHESLPAELAPNWTKIERCQQGLSWETLDALERELGWDLTEERSMLYPRRAFTSWLSHLGIVGLDSHTKGIPHNLMLMPEKQTAALLAGLWMTDGWISVLGKPRDAIYTTVSKKLADDVRVLLRVLGIHSAVRPKRLKKGTAYNVRVTSRHWGRFVDLVPLSGHKEERARAHLQNHVPSGGNRLGMIPPSFNTPAMADRKSDSGRQARTIEQMRTHAMHPEVFLDFGGDPAVATADTFWCRVVSVEPAGEAPCFDLTVDTPEHLFVADTFIVHNSSLLNAVEFALWGRSRGNVVGDVITRGEQKVEVAVEFDLNDGTYKIVRSRTRKGRHEVLVSVSDEDTPGGWRELTEKNSLMADPFVIDLLGMDATTARSTWMIAQNDFGSFCEMQPSPRRAVLAAAFGLDRFNDLAKRAEDRKQRAQTALDKATYDHDSLTRRLEALNDEGPYPLLTDDELAGQGRDREARAEKYATELANLDDPELESKVGHAKEALATFETAHAAAVAHYRRDDSRTSTALTEARRLVEQTTAARDRAQEAVWEADDALRAFKEAQVEVKRAEESVAAAREEVHRLAQVPPALTAERDAIQTRAAEINERMKPLQASIHSGEGTCFACGQGLTVDQAHELLAYQEAEKQNLRDQYNAKTAQIGDDEAATRKAQAFLADQERHLSAARSTERNAEREAENIKRLADGAEQAEAAAEQALERLSVAEQERQSLGEPPAIDTSRQQALAEAVESAEQALARAKGGQEHRGDLVANRDRAREEARRVWQEQQRRQKVQAERDALTEPLEKARKALEETSKDLQTFGVLHESFKPSGIPAMILAGVVEELNEEANDILGGLGDDGLGVTVSTHREKARGGVEEKVMIYAVTADGHADYSTLSGSEKFRIALALRLGLARCIARRTGSPIETIVMDEGWGALDEETQRAVQDVLTRLSTEFAVFTVSHIENVRDAFPNLIEVDMSTGTSKATVLTR